MLIIGLTGGIASGKSTVSEMFSEATIPVICADELAHAAVNTGSPALDAIRAVWGSDVIDSAGGLDRVKTAKIVFNDPAARKQLENIIHPEVMRRTIEYARELKRLGHDLVVVDVPLLLESNWEPMFDAIVLVYAPREVQMRRLIHRNSMNREEASLRLQAQMDIEKKRDLSDFIIDNAGTSENTKSQVTSLVGILRSEGAPRRGKLHDVIE